MMEAHEDPEVFRLRLGKALDFEYNEVSLCLRDLQGLSDEAAGTKDSFAGLFQRKDPREAGPLLDMYVLSLSDRFLQDADELSNRAASARSTSSRRSPFDIGGSEGVLWCSSSTISTSSTMISRVIRFFICFNNAPKAGEVSFSALILFGV